MKHLHYLFFLGATEEQQKKRYIIDAGIALILSLGITVFIYILKLYPKIPNISFLYLLVVLGLASTRGLYAALVASIVAFLSFDFLLVDPILTLSISRIEEWLALAIFLITSIITGQLASALRRRAEVATEREKETRALYELVNSTINTDSLDRQLDIIAHAIVNNFARVGVRDCAILLPDPHSKLMLLADAVEDVRQMHLSTDETGAADSVMKQGRIIDVHTDQQEKYTGVSHHLTRILNSEGSEKNFVKLLPLHQGEKTVGVVRLIMSGNIRRFPVERSISDRVAHEPLNHQSTFFWTFLDQGVAMIERARLQQEAMEIELLRRTDALRSALLSSVSHDLRTPLASIKAAASSLLQSDVEWDEESKKSFAIAIEKEADRLNHLVGNLLDMSRIEGGALKPEKELYPLTELIQDVLGHMQSLLRQRVVHLNVPEDVPAVELDYLQIDQVLTNLLENAVRYTPQGSPLEVAVQVTDNEVMISIADHGPGIPPFDLERIFDKFYRVSGAKRTETSIMGTGLGLAVSRGIIEAHGGRIWAENGPDGGAIFHFTLPVVAE